MVGLLVHLEALLHTGRQDGAQGVALVELGQEPFHRHRLPPERQVSHQLVAAGLRIAQKADVAAVIAGND
jgi:hypothetical protein